MEKFIVKHYIDNTNPSIKGNGFDGLALGEDREEAQEFIDFVNNLIEQNQSLSGKLANFSDYISSLAEKIKIPEWKMAILSEYQKVYPVTAENIKDHKVFKAVGIIQQALNIPLPTSEKEKIYSKKCEEIKEEKERKNFKSLLSKM